MTKLFKLTFTKLRLKPLFNCSVMFIKSRLKLRLEPLFNGSVMFIKSQHNITKLLNITIFAITLLFSTNLKAENIVAISTWQETSSLSNKGKTSEIIIQGKITNIPEGQYMTSFSISFDPKRKIKITKAISDKISSDYSFANNHLEFKFHKPKRNNSTLSLYFTFEEEYDQINKYLRHELIDVPKFAAGANAKVTLIFPWYLESATLNNNVTRTSNSFIYNNKVPKEGVKEVIKLTPLESVWDVDVKLNIHSDLPFGNLKVTLPPYFESNGQKVENFFITSSIKPQNWQEEGGNKILNFNTFQRKVQINTKARVYSGRNNRKLIVKDIEQYLKTTPEERALLLPVIIKIKQDPNYYDLPLYAKIGKYVNELIEYDINYVGKLPEVKQIIQNPIGVCTEYATLYDALARVAGIPSVIIDGGACGEYQKCRGHSWNMIYQNGQWIEVDPTWDLMSGTVSSSHIYFSDRGKGSAIFQYFGEKKNIGSSMEFEMKNLK